MRSFCFIICVLLTKGQQTHVTLSLNSDHLIAQQRTTAHFLTVTPHMLVLICIIISYINLLIIEIPNCAVLSFTPFFGLIILSSHVRKSVVEALLVIVVMLVVLCEHCQNSRSQQHSCSWPVPCRGLVSFIGRGGLSLGVGGGIMGQELVWPFFFFFLVSSLLSFLSLCQLCSI